MSAGKTSGIEAALARAAQNYDRLPYESCAFPLSQPSRLGAIARAFGLEAAPVGTARVLELGCASGGNIIPHAMLHPEARFVGVDLSTAQVEAARARIARLGLRNIEIHRASLTEIGGGSDGGLGSFDYILCHGVYSWVPAPVREAIFRIVGGALSPLGVACVSYNVLPGWRMRQPLHDALLADMPDDLDLPARVARARALLAFLAAASPDTGPYGDALRAQVASIADAPDDYIAHEFLEESSHPTTLRAFAAEAAQHGLGVLGECELAPSVLDNHDPELARQVRSWARGDRLTTEQYLDLLTGRTFRQTLLVSEARRAAATLEIAPHSIAPLHFLAEAGMRIDWTGSGHVVTDAAGRSFSTASGAVAQGIAELIARFPASSSLDECAAAIARGDTEHGRVQLLDALHHMALAGMVILSSEPVPAGRGKEATPRAIALARADAAEGAAATTNLRHEPVVLASLARALLPAMDGSNDRAALAHRLAEQVQAGLLTFRLNGAPVTDPAAVAKMALEGLPTMLAGLADAGLIAA